MRRAAAAATLALCCCIALAGCEKRRLLARIGELEANEAAVRARMTERREALLRAEEERDEASADLAQHNTEMHAYLLQHKLAAACLRAASMSVADDTEYSSQLAGMARWGAAFCGVAMLSQQFANEVTEVATKLGEADRRARELKQRIARIERSIDAERTRIRDDERDMDAIASELATLRHRLAAR